MYIDTFWLFAAFIVLLAQWVIIRRSSRKARNLRFELDNLRFRTREAEEGAKEAWRLYVEARR